MLKGLLMRAPCAMAIVWALGVLLLMREEGELGS